MAFKMNKVKADLCSFPPYIIYGLPKSGKSTLFRDLVLHNYGSADKGLLISVGDEEGYHSLDNLQVTVAKNWNDDFDEEDGVGGLSSIVDYIVENNGELGLKMVCFDTYDKLVEIGTAEVLRMHKKEKGTVCKSLNDALGGYGKGRERLRDIVREQISKLRSINVAVFFLSHCKVKEKEDLLTGQQYEQLTNNLNGDMWNVIADIAQMIVCINTEKNIVEGKLIGSERMMHFVSDGLIDCGTRFANMVDKLPLSAENFMEAFNQGVKGSMGNKVSDADIEKRRVEEEKAQLVATEKVLKQKQEEKEEVSNSALVKKIQESVNGGTMDMKQMQSLMKEYAIKNFADADSLPTECLVAIVELIK